MSSDINVQTFSGKVNITSNLLVGSSHLFVDTINNRVGLVTANPQAGLHVESNTYVRDDFRVGSGIVMNETPGRITAGAFHGAFVGDGSGITSVNSDSGSWVNGTSSNVHLATTGDKVGIGVVEPLYKLDVDGDINMSTGSQLRMNGTPAVFSNWDVSGSDISRSSGNVGIGGAASATNTLKVHGTVEATEFSGIQESDVPTLSAYATTSDLSTGLSTKQDSGSHAVINGVHAQFNLHGGGNVVFNSSGYLKWDTRIIAIPVKEPEFGSSGYIDIDCPTSGTITYYNSSGTETTKTCTADGIPIGNWEALWYVVTPGQSKTSVQTKFVVNAYQSRTHTPDENWLLIASRNGDSHGSFLKYLPGQVNIPVGGGYKSANGTLTSPTFSGTVTATTFSGNATTASSAATLTTARNINGVSFNGSDNITVNGLNYNVNDGWLRYISDGSYVRLYGNTRSMVFRTDGTTQYSSNGAYPFVWLYGGDAIGNRRMLINTSGQLWMSNYGWLHEKFALIGGDSAVDFYADRSYADDWFRAQGNTGIYWEDHGGGWQMTDQYWIRAYNNKGVIVNNQFQCLSIRSNAGSYPTRIDFDNNGHHIDCYYGNTGHVFHINHYAQATVYLNRSGYSDRRIKEDIKDIDDVSALNILRKIKPKTYKYKLQPHKGTVYGFIAQDVREVLPYATNLTKLSAPFDREKFVNATILEDGMVNLNGPCNDLEVGKMAYFYYESSTSTHDFEVTEIISPTQFRVRVDDGVSQWIGNTMLVGKEVNDFHGIDKDAIFTIATAALQEVDRQQQSDKVRITTLETQLQAEKTKTYELQQKVELLEMSHGALVERIEALEKL